MGRAGRPARHVRGMSARRAGSREHDVSRSDDLQSKICFRDRHGSAPPPAATGTPDSMTNRVAGAVSLAGSKLRGATGPNDGVCCRFHGHPRR